MADLFCALERKMNIDLCLEVEKLPYLYDSSLEDHSKRYLTEKAWKDIGRKLGVSGEICKKRWMNLRTVYVRRKTKTPRKKEYYLNRYMQFLTPHINPPKYSNSNKPSTSSYDKSYQNDQPFSSEQEQTSESQYSNNDDNSVFVKEEPLNDDTDNQMLMTDDSTAHQTIENITTPVSNVDDSFMDYLQPKKMKMSVDSEDPRRCFLLSLLPEVNEMHENGFRLFKRRVLGLIDELNTT